MTVENPAVRAPSRPETDDGNAIAVRDLVAGMAVEPWGQTSPSVYETGRLVTIAPWLTGHAERVSYLLDSQRADGGWGAPEGYALVPTLSATEALLAMLRAVDGGTRSTVGVGRLAGAADRGLRALHGWLGTDGPSIPDTPAVDLIVPALVILINRHLDGARAAPVTGLDAWRGDGRLGLPATMTGKRLATVRQLLASGAQVPEKLLHALEVVDELAHRARGVLPVAPGTIGGSPAATAAWLGDPGPAGSRHAALAYLQTVARRQAGPVPCATPITVFERAWVLSGLARAGAAPTVSPELVRSLHAAFDPGGTPAGPGLPPDADTTAVALYALALCGVRTEPDSLWAFDTGTHFSTWPGEDGFSVTTNAHVLDALGQHVAAHGGAATRYRAAVARLSVWLSEQQEPDGAWRDRWHASPYYASACCVLALDEFGAGRAAGEAVARAVDWVLATQRPDGSWGRWGGTVEETAYAIQVLLGTARPVRPEAAAAGVRGHAYLLSAAGQQQDLPLWHDKDLYRPSAIVRAAVLSARHLAQSRRGGATPAEMPKRQ